ncbi:MAG: cobalamin-binding protein [Firmicutes bacterium]|nr:cobalamin-binding protein [Bacillota bacterium]
MSDLIEMIVNLDEQKTINCIKKRLNNGESAMQIFEECMKGIEKVGQKYSEGFYFLSDLIMAGEIFRAITEILEPLLPEGDNAVSNDLKVVIGTVKGDIHDLGKNLIAYYLKSKGFKVYDLGVDVPPEKFINTLKETGASILGICTLLTSCFNNIKKIVGLLDEAGLRNDITVIIGGYPVDETVKNYVGADYFSNNARSAFDLFKHLS